MTLNLMLSESRCDNGIPVDAIREELTRVLNSSMFAQSDRLGRFLRFTVETTLAGGAETLKEYLIGTEVYERGSSYHPSEDSIVRSEARRLRSKLKEYYDSVGKYDLIRICYRPGSYVPAFAPRSSGGDESPSTNGNPGELQIRVWRNIQTDGNDPVQVEVQARITDLAQYEGTACYACHLLHRLSSLVVKDATSLDSNLALERVSRMAARPTPPKSNTRTREGERVRTFVARVDRIKLRERQSGDRSA